MKKQIKISQKIVDKNKKTNVVDIHKEEKFHKYLIKIHKIIPFS